MNLDYKISRFNTGKIIKTGKTINFVENGQTVKGVYWRTIKMKELFTYLIYHKSASKHELIELLWSDHDITKATNNLYTTIYQLKQMLKSIHFNIDIINDGGIYEIQLNEVLIDIDIFDNIFKNFDAVTSENYRAYIKLMRYYDEEHLKIDPFNWKTNKHEQHKVLYIMLVYKLIDYLDGAQKYLDALFLALTLKNNYPFFQNIYLTLMQLYNKIGDYYGVHEQYQSLVEIIKNPNDYINNWYLEWKMQFLTQ